MKLLETLPEVIRTSRGRTPIFTKEAARLRHSPNLWGELKKFKSQRYALAFASRIRTGKIAAFPKGEFEAVAQSGIVYVRSLNPVAPRSSRNNKSTSGDLV